MLTGIKEAYNYGVYTYFFGPYYEKMLFNAIKTGNIEQAKFALLNKANINYQEAGTLDMPLHKAASQGDTALVKLLLEREGISINGVNKNNETPLFQAAMQGHTETILLLMNKGADLLPVFDMLILNDNVDPLKALVKNLKLTDNTQANDLIINMLKNNKLDMALDFIKNVPNFEIHPNVILEYAIKNSPENFVKILLKEFPNIDEKHLNKLLNLAVTLNKNGIAQLMLTKGASSNNEFTPLLYAIQNGYSEIVQTLIQAGAKLNVQDIKGDSALHIAINTSSLDIFKMLVNNHNLNLNDTNFEGITANQLISNKIEQLKKLLRSSHEEFQKNLLGQVQRYSYKKNLSNIVKQVHGSLIEEEQKIFAQIEKFIAMQTLLNNAETLNATFNKTKPSVVQRKNDDEHSTNLLFLSTLPSDNNNTNISTPTTSSRPVGGKGLREELDEKDTEVKKRPKN